MREHSRDPLAEVASAVADGTPVDWSAERRVCGPELHQALEDLSILERIRDVHASTGGVAPKMETIEDQILTREVPVAAPLFRWGRLEALAEVGEGGWGKVYRAFDPMLQTEVALKILKREESAPGLDFDRFLAEARRLARVRHPNVVSVYGADRHDDVAGIWMEFIRGQTLEQFLAVHGPLAPREATAIGLDLCRALAAVHGSGLVHRDVKAGNVMRETGGRIVLMDFGSGVELPARGTLPPSRHMYGTPLTMAPEQLFGETAGAATDVYGLGTLLYRLVSGGYPIEASSWREVAERHRNREYIRLRDRRAELPLDFVQVVERAIAPDPKERFASAGDLEHALAALSSKVPEPAAPRRPWWHALWLRSPIVRVAGALGVVAAVALILLLPRNRDHRDEGITPVVPMPPPVTQTAGASQHRPALTATASLRRFRPGGEEVLAPGSRLTLGDRLSMMLEGSDSMYVYVINEDRQGNVYVLFPIPGLRPVNPIPPSVRQRLPGQIGDSLVYWNVTTPGERETIITVASRSPLEEWEKEIRRFPRASRDRPATAHRVSDETVRTLRGLGGLSVEPPRQEGASRSLAQSIRALEEGSLRTGDVWIWSAELENPGPNP